MKFLKTPYDLPLLVFWLAALTVVVINLCIPYPGVRGLKKEIYQVRGQIVLSWSEVGANGEKISNSQATILLRNGRGQDFQVVAPEALPGDTYFARPCKNKDGNWILVPVKNIEEEQELENKPKTQDKEV